MSNSMKVMLAGAALAGLLTGTSAKLQAQTTNQNQNAGIRAVSMQDDGGTNKTDKDKTEKHACKGQNSCKGKGGCKSSDNGCKGKNDCKGKGGCATDGSKKNAGRSTQAGAELTHFNPNGSGLSVPALFFSWKN